jgi:drug/metabolite transporter (DMT)-like permease
MKRAAAGPHHLATLAGLGAILLWSGLAAITLAAGTLPPFQLIAMCFGVAAFVGVLYLAFDAGARRQLRKTPWGALALGVAGLFGFHFFYFLALGTAPPVQANLINYLWPLLVVLLSGVLPGASEPLRLRHLAGCGLAFCGALLLLADENALAFERRALAGYGAACLAAVIWAGYSLLLRNYSGVPSAAVALSCALTALLSALAHLAFEETRWPDGTRQWLAVLALGLGPVGLAFYIWDYGCKHGDLRLLGTAAYATPLLSTAVLTTLGIGTGGAHIWLAALLISGGALVTVSRRPSLRSGARGESDERTGQGSSRAVRE